MYPKDHRLRKSKEIEKLFKNGKSFLTPTISIRFAKNNLGSSRFAVIISTKVHKRAVKRNLIKRRLRAVLREVIETVKPGLDIAISARPLILKSSFQETKNTLLWALRKANLIN